MHTAVSELMTAFEKMLEYGCRYCCVCLRMENEKNLIKPNAFKAYIATLSKKNLDFTEMTRVCTICEEKAKAALRFLKAAHLTVSIQELYSDMLKNKSYRKEVQQHFNKINMVVLTSSLVNLTPVPQFAVNPDDYAITSPRFKNPPDIRTASHGRAPSLLPTALHPCYELGKAKSVGVPLNKDIRVQYVIGDNGDASLKIYNVTELTQECASQDSSSGFGDIFNRGSQMPKAPGTNIFTGSGSPSANG